MTDIVQKMEDGGAGDLYFYLQRYKKELRLQFLQDIARMKAENATEEELLARLIKQERSVKIMRFAFDQVAGNPNPDFSDLLQRCDEYGLNEFKDRVLFVRLQEKDRDRKELKKVWSEMGDWHMTALKEEEQREVRAAFEVIKANSRLPVNESGTDGMKGLTWLQMRVSLPAHR